MLKSRTLGDSIDLEAVGEVYQDVWRNGLQFRGVRNCEDRYLLIQAWLRNYTRAFSVLDIGACFGYFGARINEDFPLSVIAAVEGDAGYQRVLNQVVSAYDGLFAVPYKVAMRDLSHWSRSEHFDVVLALSVVHHFPGAMLENIKSLRALGRNLILEVPVRGERACNQSTTNKEYDEVLAYLDKHGTRLGEVESHTPQKAGEAAILKRPVYHLPGTWERITRPYLLYPKARTCNIRVEADFNKARLINYVDGEHRDLVCGFNLFNLMALGHKYVPESSGRFEFAFNGEGGDIRPWNMILGRGRITMIDARSNGLNELWTDALDRSIKGIKEGWLDTARYRLDYEETTP